MNRPIKTYVLRSLAATAIGWALPTALVYVFPYENLPNWTFWEIVAAHLLGYATFLIFMLPWVVPTWLLVLLPLALFVSPRNRFWHPLIVGPTGLIIGGSVLWFSIVIGTGNTELEWKTLAPLAALAAGVGLVAGLLMSYFMRRQTKAFVSPVSMKPETGPNVVQ